MFGAILGIFNIVIGPLLRIGEKIADYKTEQVKVSGNVKLSEINRDIEETHDKRFVLVAEASNPFLAASNALARGLLALGPICILTKIYIWDKSIGPFVGCVGNTSERDWCDKFTTDSMDPNLWWIILAIVSFYYLTSKRT